MPPPAAPAAPAALPIRVLLVPFPLAGHLSPFLALAHELGRRGHPAAIYAEPDAEPAVRAAGGRFTVAATREAWSHAERYDDVTDLVRWAQWLSEATAPHIARLIDSMQPDALVIDEMHLGAALAAEASGRPWLSLPTSPVLRFPGFHDWPSMVPTNRLLGRLRLSADGRNSLACGRSRWGSLLPWTPAFQVGPLGPDDLHVGPLLWNGATARPLDGTRPEILVSVSTSPHVDLLAQLERFLREVTTALAELPHTSLVTASGRLHAALPPHVRMVPFADHGPLIASLRLFIHHGGWGSIGRCLLHGVPMIICPFERDQPANGVLCQRLGLAVLVEPARTSAAELRQIVERLASGDTPESRSAAAHAAILAAAPPAPRAVTRLLELPLRPAPPG